MEEEDRCKWLLTKSGSFSVKSMYLALKLGSVKWKHEGVWLTRVPMKIKVFLWLVFHKSILTKDVLIRRGWKGKDSKCCFCDELETIDHLFFGCVMANYVWNVVKCATGVMDIPRHFQDMSEWIMRFPVKDRNVISVGVAAVFWAIWKTRNGCCSGILGHLEDPKCCGFLSCLPA